MPHFDPIGQGWRFSLIHFGTIDCVTNRYQLSHSRHRAPLSTVNSSQINDLATLA